MLVPLSQAASNTSFIFVKVLAKYKNLNGAILLAIAFGMLTYFKADNFVNFVFHGGQAQYHSIDNLVKKNWHPQTPFRVMTLRVRDLGPEPALAYGMYGLEAIDVYQMLQSKQRSIFNRVGIYQSKLFQGADPRLFVDWKLWQDGLYRGIEKQVSLDYLKLVNCGFIITPIPFEEKNGLRLVSGPDTPPLTKFDRKDQFLKYIKQRIQRLYKFPDMYIYALSDVYPQVFAADKLFYVPDDLGDEDHVRSLASKMKKGSYIATIKNSQRSKFGEFSPGLRIESFKRVRDGFEISIDAHDGGVAVINSVYLKYWSANADGKPVEIIPVNYIQMGVKVPPKTHKLRFSYHRPDMSDLFYKIFGYLKTWQLKI